MDKKIFFDVLSCSQASLTDYDDAFIQNFLDIELQLKDHNTILTHSAGSSRWNSKQYIFVATVLSSSASLAALVKNSRKLLLTAAVTSTVFYLSRNLWRHRVESKVLKNLKILLATWQSFTKTSKKVLQFLKEMELVEKGFMFPSVSIYSATHAEPSSANPLNCTALRTTLCETLLKMCEHMDSSLNHLLKSIPAHGLLDSDSHYVKWECFAPRFPEDDSQNLSSLKELFNIWCILCSQLCRRLLINVYEMSDKNKIMNALETLICDSLPKSEESLSNLELNFRYYNSWSSIESAPRITESTSDLSSSVNSLRNHLTALFLITNDVLKASCDRAEIEQLLQKIKLEQINLAATIESTVAALENMCCVPVVTTPEVKIELKVEEEKVVVTIDENWVEVNEDEVLEAFVSKEERSFEDFNECVLSREEARKLIQEKKKQSKFMLSELQNVLKGRAESWAEREAKARLKKYGVETTCEPTEDEVKKIEPSVSDVKTVFSTGTTTTGELERTENEGRDFECDGTESVSSQEDFSLSAFRPEAGSSLFAASFASEIKALLPSRRCEEEIVGEGSSEEGL